MIYNKINSQTNSSTPSFTFSSQTAQKSCPIDVRSNQKTREIPSPECFDRDEIQPFLPIHTKRRDVRKRIKSIKKSSSKRTVFGAVPTVFISLGICFGIIYLAYRGIYAPKPICDVFSAISGYVYDTSTKEAKNDVFDISGKIFSDTPVYLSQSKHSQSAQKNKDKTSDGLNTPEKTDSISQFFAASHGEVIPDTALIGSSTAISPKDSIKVSSTNAGTTGADGEIYYPLITRSLPAQSFLSLTNDTRLAVDTSKVSSACPSAFQNLTITKDPLVLILHTHATECYSDAETGSLSYLSSEPTRSDDKQKNVVAVGDTLRQVLSDFGINALHCTDLHDKASFISAYSRSYECVQQYLEQYPSIRFVIDLHRDAINSGNQKTKLITEIGGEHYAQLMFVVGTDESYSNHPTWQNNLSLALTLQNSSQKLYPGLFRKTNLRSASFNQQLSDGYLLLEVGTCANNLEEAKHSAEAFGTILAKEILRNNKT